MSLYIPPRFAPTPPVKAGPIGPGAGPLTTEFPLALILGRGTPQERMKRWLTYARDAGWPYAAEDAISTAILRQPWALEDADGTDIDDAYPNPHARAAYALIDKPMAQLAQGEGARYTRPDLWNLTFRHAGICGSAFWFLNARNIYGQPLAIKYIAPWRMTPNDDANGNLQSWQLDKTPTNPGISLSLEEVIHFFIHPPDTGHFGLSVMERALLKVQNDAAFDKHVAQVLSAGGRLSGLLAPKQGDAINDQQYQQLVADARTVVEQPDAAKRLQVLRGPVDFTQTTMTIQDLQVVDLLKLYRDDTLALWGVPPGYLVPQPLGINSGSARKQDEEVLWKNAAHSRVAMFVEALQQDLVDRWQAVGVTLDFEIVEPVFDDDSGRYDLLGKSVNTPLRNRERRALVNLDPFGPDVINPATGYPVDDEIWLPNLQVMAFVAPDDVGTRVAAYVPEPVAVDESQAGSDAAGETPTGQATAKTTPGKATLADSLKSLRAQLDAQVTPRVRDAIARVFEEQKTEVITRARAQVAHLLLTRDFSGLWDDAKWDDRLRGAMQPALTDMAYAIDGHIRGEIAGTAKAGPVGAVAYALDRAGTRITDINHRTRNSVLRIVRNSVAESIAEGRSPAEAGDALEEAIGGASLDNGIGAWDEYRSEMVARTEMTAAYNAAQLGTYGDLGVQQVQAIDGIGDEECADRNGNIFGIDEADTIEDHPNGTLDWIPVIPEGD